MKNFKMATYALSTFALLLSAGAYADDYAGGARRPYGPSDSPRTPSGQAYGNRADEYANGPRRPYGPSDSPRTPEGQRYNPESYKTPGAPRAPWGSEKAYPDRIVFEGRAYILEAVDHGVEAGNSRPAAPPAVKPRQRGGESYERDSSGEDSGSMSAV